MTKTRNWCWINSFLLSDGGLSALVERMCFELKIVINSELLYCIVNFQNCILTLGNKKRQQIILQNVSTNKIRHQNQSILRTLELLEKEYFSKLDCFYRVILQVLIVLILSPSKNDVTIKTSFNQNLIMINHTSPIVTLIATLFLNGLKRNIRKICSITHFQFLPSLTQFKLALNLKLF